MLLLGFCKFGGIAAVALGVLYLSLSRLVRHGVIPKLKQWQAFLVICLLATFALVIALSTILGYR